MGLEFHRYSKGNIIQTGEYGLYGVICRIPVILFPYQNFLFLKTNDYSKITPTTDWNSFKLKSLSLFGFETISLLLQISVRALIVFVPEIFPEKPVKNQENIAWMYENITEFIRNIGNA